MRDVAFGLVGGAVGAMLWAGVVYFIGYEIGWIAWGVGGLVGFSVALGNADRQRSASAAGGIAVAITALSIVAGKYAAVEMLMPSDAEIMAVFLESFESEEYVVSFVADVVVADFEASGRTLSWPEGVDPTNASSQSEYPQEVWAEAAARWAGLSLDEQSQFRTERETETRQNLESNLPELRAMVSQGGFLGSFAPMDLIFFGLATVTAFGMGSGKKPAEEIAAEYEQAIKLAMLKIMMADGSVDQEEIAVIGSVYQQLTGHEITPDSIKSEAAAVQSSEALLNSLAELSPHLPDGAKEQVVKAAIMVAVSDGEVSQEEQVLVYDIARALGMSENHLRGTLAEFTTAQAT